MAILDLLTILASLSVLNSGFKVLKLFRLLRTFRVLRVFKAFRYSKNVAIILDVFKKQKEALTVVGVLAVGYIIAIVALPAGIVTAGYMEAVSKQDDDKS